MAHNDNSRLPSNNPYVTAPSSTSPAQLWSFAPNPPPTIPEPQANYGAYTGTMTQPRTYYALSPYEQAPTDRPEQAPAPTTYDEWCEYFRAQELPEELARQKGSRRCHVPPPQPAPERRVPVAPPARWRPLTYYLWIEKLQMLYRAGYRFGDVHEKAMWISLSETAIRTAARDLEPQLNQQNLQPLYHLVRLGQVRAQLNEVSRRICTSRKSNESTSARGCRAAERSTKYGAE